MIDSFREKAESFSSRKKKIFLDGLTWWSMPLLYLFPFPAHAKDVVGGFLPSLLRKVLFNVIPFYAIRCRWFYVMRVWWAMHVTWKKFIIHLLCHTFWCAVEVPDIESLPSVIYSYCRYRATARQSAMITFEQPAPVEMAISPPFRLCYDMLGADLLMMAWCLYIIFETNALMIHTDIIYFGRFRREYKKNIAVSDDADDAFIYNAWVRWLCGAYAILIRWCFEWAYTILSSSGFIHGRAASMPTDIIEIDWYVIYISAYLSMKCRCRTATSAGSTQMLSLRVPKMTYYVFAGFLITISGQASWNVVTVISRFIIHEGIFGLVKFNVYFS